MKTLFALSLMVFVNISYSASDNKVMPGTPSSPKYIPPHKFASAHGTTTSATATAAAVKTTASQSTSTSSAEHFAKCKVCDSWYKSQKCPNTFCKTNTPPLRCFTCNNPFCRGTTNGSSCHTSYWNSVLPH